MICNTRVGVKRWMFNFMKFKCLKSLWQFSQWWLRFRHVYFMKYFWSIFSLSEIWRIICYWKEWFDKHVQHPFYLNLFALFIKSTFGIMVLHLSHLNKCSSVCWHFTMLIFILKLFIYVFWLEYLFMLKYDIYILYKKKKWYIFN